MRLPLALALATLWGVQAAPAQEAAAAPEFYFVGIHKGPDGGRGYYCRDMVLEHRPVESQADYALARRDFVAAHPNEDARTYLLSPTEAAVVVTYTSHATAFGCDVRLVAVYRGLTPGVAREGLAANIRSSPRSYKTVPEEAVVWEARNAREVVRTYDGVEVRYIVVQTSPTRTTMMARGRNTRGDQAAVVRITPAGGTPWTDTLNPGESFTLPVGAPVDLTIEVQLRDPVDRSPGIIDRAKALLRGLIGPGDLPPPRSGPGGTRG